MAGGPGHRWTPPILGVDDPHQSVPGQRDVGVSLGMARLRFVVVALLRRDRPFATLEAARQAATRGRGSVVVVSGEPGIGKSHPHRPAFVAGLADRGRVWRGLCDDLSIPRPLGPFRDIATASPAVARALTGRCLDGASATC